MASGVRLLREYSHQIGLDRAFTIHDREDSADLMNLVRHEIGLSQKETRFPTKSTCLAIYSRVVNSEESLEAVLTRMFPWCCTWEDELRCLLAAYVEAKQRQHVLDYDDLLLYWSHMMLDEGWCKVADRIDVWVRTRERCGGAYSAPGPSRRSMTRRSSASLT